METLSTADAIRTRRSTRSFSSKKIPDQLIYELLELSNRAPSGYNLQPWHFVIVRDQEIKGLLYHVALQQKQVLDAPLTVVFVANPRSWKTTFPHILEASVEQGSLSSEYASLTKNNVHEQFRIEPFGLFGFVKRVTHPLKRLKAPMAATFTTKSEIRQYAREQTMLAAATFMIAASGAGLSTSPIEGFDEQRVKRLLSIPPYMSVPLLVPVGYSLETEDSPLSYRLPLLEKLSVDLFPNTLARLKTKRST